MPRDKSKYSDKQKRQARHIEKGYKLRGLSEATAAARAWATVHKFHEGGNKPGGSGYGKMAKFRGQKRMRQPRPRWPRPWRSNAVRFAGTSATKAENMPTSAETLDGARTDQKSRKSKASQLLAILEYLASCPPYQSFGLLSK